MSRSLLSTLLPCCFTSNPYASADAYLQPLTLRGGGGAGASDGARGRGGAAPLEDVLDASAAAREALWRRLGTLEPLALSHLVAGAAGAGPKVREGEGGGEGRGGSARDASFFSARARGNGARVAPSPSDERRARARARPSWRRAR